MKIKDMACSLREHKDEILKAQAEYEKTLPPKEAARRSCNRRPHGGWTVPGNCAFTQAVKLSGLDWDYFWSGSNPTPSTQYPIKVWEFLKNLETGGKYGRD